MAPLQSGRLRPTHSFSFMLLSLFYAFLLYKTHAQVTVSSCAALNQVIARINGGQKVGQIRIAANSNILISSCDGLTLIKASIVIVGLGTNPPIISGEDVYSIFSLENNGNPFNITLSNLVISNGASSNGYGGCLYLPSPLHSAYISNVVFRDCYGSYGAAIYTTGGALVLTSSTFLRNRATNAGGAIYVDGSTFPLTITGSTFTSNSVFSVNSDAKGGAIAATSNVTISGSVFSSNSATSSSYQSYGGAVFVDGQQYYVSITGSNFTSNFALASQSSAYGGALGVSSLILKQTTLSSNKITCYNDNSGCAGGAVSSEIFTATSSTFSNNQAITRSSAYLVGGAVNCNDCIISSSTFTGNKITAISGLGGALRSYLSLNITSSKFLSNSVVSSGQHAIGGAVYSEQSSVSIISSSTFTSNSVTASSTVASFQEVKGGAVFSSSVFYDTGNNYSDNSVTFSGINVELNVYGGAVYGANQLFINYSNFSNNKATSQASGAGGGALFAGSMINIAKSSFTGNSALSGCRFACSSFDNMGGGAIYNNYGSNIFSSNFVKNTHTTSVADVKASGGALALQSSYNVPHNISYCTFANNSASSSKGFARGGAVSVSTYYSTAYFQNSKFSGNSANGIETKGGAISLNGYAFYAFNSTFEKNTASSTSGNAHGGAIDLSDSGSSNSILVSDFVGNQAFSKAVGYARGGAIFHGYYSTYNYPFLELSQSTFTNNIASASVGALGGSIFVNDYQALISSRTTFNGSVVSGADVKGGAIYAGQYCRLYFCATNTFSLSNVRSIPKKTSVVSTIETDVGPDVRFCPLISMRVERNSTYKPLLTCDHCDCRPYFNPCDPKAACSRISNPTATTCLCPPSLPGTGFTCGVGDKCIS